MKGSAGKVGNVFINVTEEAGTGSSPKVDGILESERHMGRENRDMAF